MLILAAFVLVAVTFVVGALFGGSLADERRDQRRRDARRLSRW